MSDDKNSFGKWLAGYDNFRSIPSEFRRSTKVGGVLTILTYALIVILLVAETGAFFRTSYSTVIKMDDNIDKLIQINFDIVMHNLPCKFLRIAVFNSFGDERVDSRSEVFYYIPISSDGAFTGRAYDNTEVKSATNEHALDAPVPLAEEELDSDWASSDDHFKHKSFSDAVTHHEYTLILFYADWCSHCRTFHPVWSEMVNTMSMKKNYKNNAGHDVQVKFMKINCVDFAQTCQEQRIHAFPMIKLYNEDFGKDGPDSTPIPFAGKRNAENFDKFLTEMVSQRSREHHVIVKQEHAALHEGCQVRGYLTVPRVPGEFHLEANADQIGGQLNPAMTNVSHTVKHLSFGNVASKYRKYDFAQDFIKFPKDMMNNLSPLDDKTFTVQSVGEAPHHYLKVVSTSLAHTPDQIAYQVTHSDRISKVNYAELEIPQAKFMYDLSPLSVCLKLQQKRWYEFVTSLCAIIGGFYTVAKLTSRTVLNVVSKKDN
eukprot:GEMP01023893.1.p1 GENE.GEMP01023893.1~~GEMP01023893.1.p1  ORF type:complete len:485 (+),score=59.64 GEMP01023893.1:75-1529(+)